MEKGSPVRPKRVCHVSAMVSVFCDPEAWNDIDRIVAMDKRLWYTVGYHPSHLRKHDLTKTEEDFMKRRLQKSTCVGLGEIGLDFHHAKSPDEQRCQIRNFRHLLHFVKKNSSKPVVLHLRNGKTDNVFDLARKMISEEDMHRHKLHLHCFSGESSDVDKWLKAFPNCHFGFTVMLLDKEHAVRLSAAVRRIPSSRLLAESDAPYMHPYNMNGPNHPWNIHQVLDRFAEIKQEPLPRMYDQVLQNTKRLYRL